MSGGKINNSATAQRDALIYPGRVLNALYPGALPFRRASKAGSRSVPQSFGGQKDEK